ncbi:MAG: iron-sulfur cluster assembly scaffold protein [Emcibacteraceae bacterium]|nr:iron-sulfur cluster assembly scaffold protein [Emcibacteraceae bacterium]
MIDKLYQKTILKHAANATGHGELENPDHSVMVHNPMCGDRIKVYVKLENGELIDFSHEAKACALCQASASVLGEHFKGLTIKTINILIKQIQDSISNTNGPEENPWFDKLWQELDVFNVVRDHKSRQTCVLLPFEALKQAFEEIT